MLFAFDVLWFAGENLLNRTLRERRRILHEEIFTVKKGAFEFAEFQEFEENTKEKSKKTPLDAENLEMQLLRFFKISLSKGEGLVVKRLDTQSFYEPGAYDLLQPTCENVQVNGRCKFCVRSAERSLVQDEKGLR